MRDRQGRTQTTRRRFLLGTAAAGITLRGLGTSKALASGTSQTSDPTDLPEQARSFSSRFGLRYPIVQAPTLGPAGPALATAVAAAGAMGALPLTGDSPEDAFRLVQEVKSATPGAFFVNYVLNFEPASLDKALEAGATIVQFSWGLPRPDILRSVREAGARVGIQVTSGAGAKAALDWELTTSSVRV